jgi:phosphate transport system permease protein
MIHVFLILALIFAAGGFAATRARKRMAKARKSVRIASLPAYYGWCAAIWATVPALVLMPFYYHWSAPGAPPEIAYLLALGFIAIGTSYASRRLVLPSANAREHTEGWVRLLMWLSTAFTVSITLFIILSVLFESLRFFEHVPLYRFLFGLEWSPQMALRADQAGSSGSFGAVPVFLGTFMITLIALLVAAPLGLMSAIYLSEYASPRLRRFVKPFLEILAGIPTVVYGYFAAIIFAPALRALGARLGVDIASESALAAGVVMGIMIIPFILSLSDDVMSAVPRSLKEASLGLGATRSETVVKVVVPAALPGIMGALLLAISRGIGETMIVVMAAGLVAKLTLNPFSSVTTVTAQIVTLLVGDQEFDSPKTLAAFALGFTLFILTLILNVVALMVVRKYRERYE